MAKANNNTKSSDGTNFKIAVQDVTGRGEAPVSLGPVLLGFTRLALPRDITKLSKDDKYTAVALLTKEQREALIQELIPAAVEVALKKGLKCTSKEAEAELRRKVKETEEGSGVYRCSTEQRMVFHHPAEEGGDSYPTIIILGPDGEHFEDARLVTNGSIAYVNLVMVAVENKATGKLTFPFRLSAIKIKEAVLYEASSNKAISHDDFSQVEDDY